MALIENAPHQATEGDAQTEQPGDTGSEKLIEYDHVVSGESQRCEKVRGPGGDKVAQMPEDEAAPVEFLEGGVEDANEGTQSEVIFKTAEVVDPLADLRSEAVNDLAGRRDDQQQHGKGGDGETECGADGNGAFPVRTTGRYFGEATGQPI